MNKTTEIWLKGLAAVVIAGGADAILNMGIAPQTFNLGPGLKLLVIAALTKGLFGGAAYLKQSPLPGIKNEQ